jgi:MFS family permease
VSVAFIGLGFATASWASRIPQVQAALRVTPGMLGLILLCGAAGSALAIPLAGIAIARLGEARVTAAAALLTAVGLGVAAGGYELGVTPVAAGLFGLGFGTAAGDVAINVHGAAVERSLGRAIMPRFHAGWSLGTVAGAGLGILMIVWHVPVPVHLLAVALAVAVVLPAATRRFLPRSAPLPTAGSTADHRSPLAAWGETRTLMIGLFVLCVTVIEGAGNSWLGLGVMDGYRASAVLGSAALAVFLAAMTAGRWFGPPAIDRYGRVRVLQAGVAVACCGMLLLGFGRYVPAALAGAVLIGLGISLGYPVGMSAAADDPRQAAGRVSVASSLGYAAFLAGPPLIGVLADRLGVLHAVTLAGVLLVAALFLSRATAVLGAPRDDKAAVAGQHPDQDPSPSL